VPNREKRYAARLGLGGLVSFVGIYDINTSEPEDTDLPGLGDGVEPTAMLEVLGGDLCGVWSIDS
jgi:hypothetical protein